MALVLADRVKETTTTTGTGTVTLAGASTGFQSFAVIGNGNTTYYVIAGQGTAEWEVGIGTYTSAGTTLARTTVLASSNAGSLVSFSSGTKDVFVSYPAGKSINQDASGNVGVGTTSPTAKLDVSGNAIISGTDNTNAMLRITQLGTGNALLVEDSTNPDSTPFVIDASGVVINGYTATVATQNYGGSAITAALYQQHGNSQNTSTAAVFNWSSSVASPANLILNKSISGTNGTRGALTATGTDLGSVTFNGDDGTNFIPAALILAETDGTPGTNDMPGRLVFSTTADGASTPTERLRISSDGRLQINGANTTTSTLVGTANAFPLAVASTAYQFRAEATFNAANTSAVGFGSTYQLPTTGAFSSSYQFYASGLSSGGATITNNYGLYVAGQTVGTNIYGVYSNIDSAASRWNFYAGGTADNYFAGDVGIGTNSPVTKLEIFGNNNATWSVTASISGTTMTVTAVGSGTIAVGDLVFATGIEPYTRVTALGTGTGGIGTYTVSVYQTFASGTITGSATYGNTLIRITEADTSQAAGQPTGGLQFYTSDGSTPTAGVGAYVAAVSESITPDTALVFGTRNNAGGGIDANENMRLDSDGNLTVAGNVSSGNGLTVNSDTVSADYTLGTGFNALSVGPLTINSGVTLTVASGQRHVII